MAMPIPSPIDGYVKDGLILAYDGYQEPSGGKWKDLSSSHNDMVVGAGASFDDTYHCMAFTAGGEHTIGDCPTTDPVTWASAVTFEFICASAATQGYVLLWKGTTEWPWRPAMNFGNFLNIYLPETCSTPWLISPVFSTDRAQKKLHQYAIDGNVYRYRDYKDGNLSQGGNTQDNTITGASKVFYIGGQNVRIYAFRVYNRALTDDELAQNRALDIERFNL